MDDILSMLTAAEDPRAQMQALAAALRKQKALGLLGGLSGDRILAPVGGGVLKDAQAQEDALQKVPGQRQGLALSRQRLASGEADAADEAAKREAGQSPGAVALKQSLAKQFGLDATGVPSQALDSLLPLAEKAYSVKEQGASRRDAAAARQQPVKDRAAEMGSEADGIAQAIVDGQQPPDLKGLYKFSAPVRSALAKKGYDLTTAQQDWQAVQRHVATLNGSQQERARQAVENSTGQLSNVEDLYNQWQKVGPASGFRVLNRAALAGAKQLGGEAGAVATNLEGQIQLLASEVGNALMGGNSPTDHALKMAQTMLSGDWNEETFKKAITTLRKDLTIRKNSMLHSAPAGLSAGSRFNPPAPAAQAPATGPTQIQTDADYEALPSGAEFIAPDGSHRRKP